MALDQPDRLELRVNGETRSVEADPATPLLYVLADELHLRGPKFGCGLGQCGACTVLVRGSAVRSCVTPVSTVAGADIVTLEGLGTVDKPHPLQQAFIDEQAAQCGFCLSGVILSAKAALDRIKKTYNIALPNLKKLEDGGVTIAAGTDAGNIGTIHGPALFREFQLMKEAGLTPMQILQCATANAAKLFGSETGAHIGKLETGCFADLVILNSNPLGDIAHASDIDTVIKNGVMYPAPSILK